MLILPVLPPTIVPLFVTDRAGSAPTPVGSLPVALTAKLPEPVALMLETGPSTETYLPVTLKSALPMPVFWITPPALTPTVPVVDPVPAVTPPEPPVKVAPVPFTDTFHPAVTVLESSAPFTVMFWPAEVVVADTVPAMSMSLWSDFTRAALVITPPDSTFTTPPATVVSIFNVPLVPPN